MKRIFTVGVALAALFFASCEPNEDIYDKLDDLKEPYSERLTYVLAPADYTTASAAAMVDALDKTDSTTADLIKAQLAFNPRYTAIEYMRYVLDKNFPALKKGSAAVVTYNESTENIDYLTAVTSASKYKVSSTDYANVGGSVAAVGYFIPSSTAQENIPAILSSAIASPSANQLALVTYKQSDIEPSTGPIETEVDLFSENFDLYADKDTVKENGWSQLIETHTYWWLARSFSGNMFAQMSAFSAPGEVVAYLVSPEIDLSATTKNKLSFDIKVRFYNAPCLQVLVTNNYQGASTSWTDITSNFTLPTAEADLTLAGTHDLSAFTGKIRIAFKYSGDGANSKTTTYQIDNVSVKGVEVSKKSSKADLFKTYNDFYVYAESKWVPSTSVIAVQPHEYDEMGAPGAHNNFSADAPSINYIPTLLEVKYPYAQEGDNIVVAYNYYDEKKTTLTADLYIYKNGWESVSVGSIVTKTAQYVHLGDRWAFDPTVTFTMSKPDYQIVVDWVKDVLNRPELVDRGDAEFYAGASAYYGNYDVRISKRVQFDPDTYKNLSEKDATDLIWSRLKESLVVMLQTKFPNAVAQVSGVEVFYNVSFIVYDGISKTYTAKFQCTVDGSANEAPTFELISGPAVL